MKIEKVDVVCIAAGIFMLAAYIKIGIFAYLVAAVILILPVLFFMFRGSKQKEHKHAEHEQKHDEAGKHEHKHAEHVQNHEEKK